MPVVMRRVFYGKVGRGYELIARLQEGNILVRQQGMAIRPCIPADCSSSSGQSRQTSPCGLVRNRPALASGTSVTAASTSLRQRGRSRPPSPAWRPLSAQGHPTQPLERRTLAITR